VKFDKHGLRETDQLAGIPYAKFGYNASVGVTMEPVWAESGVMYTYPTAAQALTLSSASANDAAAGTGMRTVTISWLDANYIEQTTVLGLNGQTAVAIGNGIRVNRVYGSSYGTGEKNAGIVYVGYGAVVAGKPTTVMASIVAGENQTLQQIFTVPAGYTLLIRSALIGLSNKGEARLYQRPFGLGFRVTRVYTSDNNGMIPRADYEKAPIAITEKSDVEIRAAAAVAGIQASAEWDGVLILNV